MNPAFGNFDIRQLSENEWQLLSNFSYFDSVYGEITVTAGFKTNFASIESLRVPLFPLYAMLANYGDRAATVHDFLYSGYPILINGVPRWLWRHEIDNIFYRALLAEDVAKWRALLFWSGVRAGGSKFFSLTKKHLGE